MEYLKKYTRLVQIPITQELRLRIVEQKKELTYDNFITSLLDFKNKEEGSPSKVKPTSKQPTVQGRSL